LKQKTKTKKDPIVFRKLQEEEKGYLLIVYRMCERDALFKETRSKGVGSAPRTCEGVDVAI
jgi:hypothetical protein